MIFFRAFTISKNAANFAVFRYNEKVDTKTQILLKDFADDKRGLLQAFRKIRYGGSGMVAYTYYLNHTTN